MDEIISLFSENQDILNDFEQHELTLCKIDALEKEMHFYISRKTELEEMHTIKELTTQLTDIEKEIALHKLRALKIMAVQDLFNIPDITILKEKCVEFLNDLIYEWDETTIVIKKNTKEFFQGLKNMEVKDIYSDMKKIYFRCVKATFKDFIFTELKIEESKNEYYFSKEASRGVLNFSEFYDKNKEISNFIFEAICLNLKKRVYVAIKDQDRNYAKICHANNNLLKNTKFYIKSEEEYLEKIILGYMGDLTSVSRGDIEIDKKIRDENFSSEFSNLLFCLEGIDTIRYKDQATYHILEFFNINKLQRSLFNYMCVFSELIYVYKFYKIPQLLDIKENLFCLVIDAAEIKDINLRQNFEDIKNCIYQNQFTFKEILEYFIHDNVRLTFLISYYDAMLDYVIRYLLTKGGISISESEGMSEVIDFMCEITGIESMLNNHCKIKCIGKVLRSGLAEINEMWKNRSICLEKNDTVQLVKALFNESQKRNNCIEHILGTH